MSDGGSSERYRVAVKESALTGNGAVRERVEEALDATGSGGAVDRSEGGGRTNPDPVLRFAHEGSAVEAARGLSEAGETPVRVQRAAPTDRSDADAYLVAASDRRTEVPEGSIDSELVFDVNGNQYGALGEALVLSRRRNPPLLTHVVREDPGLDLSPTERDRLRVAVDTEPDPVVHSDPETGTEYVWHPDCRAVAHLGTDGRTLATYLVEIKAGTGSLQRDQRVAMEREACERPVLTLRLDLDGLPDSYAARVEWIEPPTGDGGNEGSVRGERTEPPERGRSGADRTLDEFS
jgi:hypothetical protein